jgi:hypothetical protein
MNVGYAAVRHMPFCELSSVNTTVAQVGHASQ